MDTEKPVETFFIDKDPLTGFPLDEPRAIAITAPPARAHKIVAQVAAAYGFTFADLTGPRRYRALVEPRWEAMRRIRDELGYTLPQIGRLFNRDHTSVLWALRGGRPNQPSRAKQPQERAA